MSRTTKECVQKNTWADLIKRKKDHSFIGFNYIENFPRFIFYAIYYKLEFKRKKKILFLHSNEWDAVKLTGSRLKIKYWLKSIFCDKMRSLTLYVHCAFCCTATMSGIVKSEKSDKCWAFFRRIVKSHLNFMECLYTLPAIANKILCISTFY